VAQKKGFIYFLFFGWLVSKGEKIFPCMDKMRGEKSSGNSSLKIFQIVSYESILIREIYKVCE